jgi:hypothetical protein
MFARMVFPKVLNSLTIFQADAIGSPLVSVSLTKGMIAADFLADPPDTGRSTPRTPIQRDVLPGRVLASRGTGPGMRLGGSGMVAAIDGRAESKRVATSSVAAVLWPA